MGFSTKRCLPCSNKFLASGKWVGVGVATVAASTNPANSSNVCAAPRAMAGRHFLRVVTVRVVHGGQLGGLTKFGIDAGVALADVTDADHTDAQGNGGHGGEESSSFETRSSRKNQETNIQGSCKVGRAGNTIRHRPPSRPLRASVFALRLEFPTLNLPPPKAYVWWFGRMPRILRATSTVLRRMSEGACSCTVCGGRNSGGRAVMTGRVTAVGSPRESA